MKPFVCSARMMTLMSQFPTPHIDLCGLIHLCGVSSRQMALRDDAVKAALWSRLLIVCSAQRLSDWRSK